MSTAATESKPKKPHTKKELPTEGKMVTIHTKDGKTVTFRRNPPQPKPPRAPPGSRKRSCEQDEDENGCRKEQDSRPTDLHPVLVINE
jgi:hypothetical protein